MKHIAALVLTILPMLCFAEGAADSTLVQKAAEATGSKTSDIFGYIIAGIAVAFAILGGLITFFGFKGVYKAAALEALSKDLNSEKSNVLRLVSEANLENRLLTTKKIYVIGDEDVTTLKEVLIKLKFDINNVTWPGSKEPEKYDLLIINYEKGETQVKEPEAKKAATDAKLQEFIGIISALRGTQRMTLYFNSTGVRLPTERLPTDAQITTGFANAPSQLYPNLMNLLKYQERVQK